MRRVSAPLASIVILFGVIGLSASPSHQADAQTVEGITPDRIEAYPEPAVTQLLPNEELLYDRRYQRVLNAIDIHDTPGGNIVGQLGAGFNFVTTQATQGDWTQTNADQWVASSALSQVLPSRFAGVLLDQELEYPFGWMLVNEVPSHEPGAEPRDGDLAILRYTPVNLYDAVTVDDWIWYQVGVEQWIQQTKIAKYLPVERPAEVDTDKWISVDLYEQVAVAYEGDQPVFSTLTASGLADWATNEGLFHVYVRYPRTVMSGAEGQSDFYYLEEVPWTMYFDGDIGLHGTYWHDGFGYRHSHGCVNLSITDAAWLYNFAYDEIDLSVAGDLGISVYVYSSGEYR